jgi:hypothetical protein
MSCRATVAIGTSPVLRCICSAAALSATDVFMSAWTALSSKFLPIRRLASNTVFFGLTDAWFFAASPTRRSFSVKATYEGVVRLPWT